MKTQHTPTPWIIGRTFISDNKNEHFIINIDDDIENCKIKVESNALDIDTIINCVNLHDDLLFGLEYLYRKTKELVRSGKISEPLLLDEITEILDRAKGG